MSQTGRMDTGYNRAFTPTVDMFQGRFVIGTGTEGQVKLPTGDNPAVLPRGVALEGNTHASGSDESVALGGTAMCEVNGTATEGQMAIVLTGGKVSNIVTNATPVRQTVGGEFIGSGTTGDLVEVIIRPQHVVQ